MKISKKIFACVLTVCMLLTMFAGVLSASAAVAGSATIGSAEINVGEAAEVRVTLNADAAIGGADLYIAFPEEAAVSAAVATEGYSLEYSVAGEMAAEGNVDLVEGVAHFILLASDDAFAGATTVEIVLTVAGLAEGEYAVAFADGTLIGTTGEVAVDAALTNGAITVIAEVACDHAETKDVVTEAATCGKAGTKNIVCALCDEVIKEGVEIPATGEHTYEEGVCGVCGAEDPNYVPPVVGPTLADGIRFRDPDVSIGATLEIRIRLYKNSIPADAASYELVVVPTKYEVVDQATVYNEYVAEEIIIPLDSSSANYDTYFYKDAAMYELGLNVDAYVRCYDANGNYIYYSNTLSFVPADAIMALYNSTSFESTKALITDMLNMGAKAQEFIASVRTGSDAYNTVQNGGLVNAALPTQDLAGSLGTLPTAADPVWNPDSSITNTTNKVLPDFALGIAPTPTLLVYKASTLKENFSLEVSYTSNIGGEKVSYPITGDAWGTSGTKLRHDVSLAYYDGDAEITMKLSYNGVEACTVTCSVLTGLNSLITSSSNTYTVELAKATAIFCATARAYVQS